MPRDSMESSGLADGVPDGPTTGEAQLDAEAYLARLGLDPASVESPDLATLERIQYAHVTTVPFENLAIVGHPDGEWEGEGVALSVEHLYGKVVERERGGYCFELNGLFHWLLDELGYDVDRVAARVTGDGGAQLPANHHSNLVHLDRTYVVDVGMGTPQMRRPVPLDGEARTDDLGIEWRVAESDRPDAAYRTEYRNPDETDWSRRYVFSPAPRDLDYFAATNDYLQSAPESPFTGDPIVSVGTADGYRKLSGETLTVVEAGEERERTIDSNEWVELLDREFGVTFE